MYLKNYLIYTADCQNLNTSFEFCASDYVSCFGEKIENYYEENTDDMTSNKRIIKDKRKGAGPPTHDHYVELQALTSESKY